MSSVNEFFDRKLQQVMARAQKAPDPEFGLSPAAYVAKWKRVKTLAGQLAGRTRPEGTPAAPAAEDLSVHVLREWATELATLLDDLARAEDAHGYYRD